MEPVNVEQFSWRDFLVYVALLIVSALCLGGSFAMLQSTHVTLCR